MIQKVVLSVIFLQASIAMANEPLDPRDSVNLEEKEVSKLSTSVEDYIQKQISEMESKYRFVRTYEEDGKSYFMYAEDILGESTYKVLGVDNVSKSSFVLTVY